MRLLIAALALASTFAAAQEFPARPVRLIIPYTPGSGADILARMMGPKLSERWKVPVVVENRIGATGIIGSDFVAKSAPDGHTMLVAASSFATNPALTPNLPYDPVKSFSPVILLATGQLAVVVNAGVPAGSLREFIDLVKKNPGKLNYASLGNGSPQHLNMELLKLELGLDVVSVPYKSSASALTDLAGGQVQAIVTSIPSAGPFVNSGKMRFLGVMSASRAPSFPSVPTLAELGHANLEVETWYGVLAPAGTPSGAVTRVNADWNAVLREPEMRGVLGKQGLDAAGGRPEQFSELIKRELPRWQRVVSAAGIKPD